MQDTYKRKKPPDKKAAPIRKLSEPASIEDLDDDERLREYTKKVDSWYDYFNMHLERASNYLTFLYVDGWEPTIRQQREAQSKPTLEFNKIVPIVNAMIGEQRNNSPQLTVRGCDDKTPQEWVDWRNDLLRQIAYESKSDIAYQSAFKAGLEIGWGSVEVSIENESPLSFNQVIRIKTTSDYQAAFWDPAATEPDKSDGDYCGKYLVMSKDDFERTYPDVENPQSMGNTYYYQEQAREIVILCDLYVKCWHKKTLCKLSNGEEMEYSDAKKLLAEQEEMWNALSDDDKEMQILMGRTPVEIERKEDRMDYYITKVRMIQNKILEETPWPGKLLPIPYFEGNSVVLKGETIPVPMVQGVIDTQRLINLYGSEIAYSILMARREQYFATPDQIKGHEPLWRQPQNVQGALLFNPDNRVPGPPTPIAATAFNEGLLQAQQDSTAQIAQIMGRYEEARGQESNAISGKAINSRQRASNLPMNVYLDNNQRGIEQVGKIIMELIPHVYTGQRNVVVRDAQSKARTVSLNKPTGKYQFTEDGQIGDEIIENPTDQGSFSLEVRVDGSFDAQRMEALETLISFATVYPPMAPLLPDLIAENSGLESAQKLIERAKTLLPPNIKAIEEGKPEPPPQPNPMQEMEKQKLQLEMQSLQQKNQQAQMEMQAKQQQMQLDQIKLENQRVETMVKAQQDGINAQVQLDKAHADIVNTRVKAATEVHKSKINMQTAAITHGTKRMTQYHQMNTAAKKSKQSKETSV